MRRRGIVKKKEGEPDTSGQMSPSNNNREDIMRRLRCIEILAILLFIHNLVFATIINVPADQPTIQAGINVAVDGDTVLVHLGIYVENINYNGKNIVVGSLFLTTQDTSYISQTVINGNQNGSVVKFASGEDSTAVLNGFTVKNGFATWHGGGINCYNSNPSLSNVRIIENHAEWDGGGIRCHSANPSLKDITISGNSSVWNGGGLYCNRANPSLENVTISENSSEWDGGGLFCFSSSPNLENVAIYSNSSQRSGGGLYCHSDSISLKNVTISSNSSEWYGGGIYCHSANPSLIDVTISSNSAYKVGGGLYCHSASPILENVTISQNLARLEGGGIYCHSSSPIFKNVTISENSSTLNYHYGGGIYFRNSNPSLENVRIGENTAYNGGGIYFDYYSNSTLVNVIISGNSADTNGGGIACIAANLSLLNVTISDNLAECGGGVWCSSNSYITMVNSIMWNNSPEEILFRENYDPDTITIAYSDIHNGENGIVTNNNGTVNWLDGNINEDPLFVDTLNGDYHLTSGSPCIDAGTAFFVWQADTLINIPDSAYYGTAPDMGAYEWWGYGIDDDFPDTSHEFSLFQNYPNPLNQSTTIGYYLPKSCGVEIQIYNLKGQVVKKYEVQNPKCGMNKIKWDGKDEKGNPISSGIYFYQIIAGKHKEIKKCILLK